MSETVKKVLNACRWGSPDPEVTEEIVGEVQALVDANLRFDRLVLRVRQLCEPVDKHFPELAAYQLDAIRAVLNDQTV